MKIARRVILILLSAVVHVQLAEQAVFQMKQHGGVGSLALSPVLPWQLEEAQVFWAKGEQELALGLLKQMIKDLEKMVRREQCPSFHIKQINASFTIFIFKTSKIQNIMKPH